MMGSRSLIICCSVNADVDQLSPSFRYIGDSGGSEGAGCLIEPMCWLCKATIPILGNNWCSKGDAKYSFLGRKGPGKSL